MFSREAETSEPSASANALGFEDSASPLND